MMTEQTRKTTVSNDEWKRNVRRSARVKTNFQLKVWIMVNEQQTLLPGYARNISGEGICAFIPADLAIDQQVELQFALPGSARELTLQGIIRAVNEFQYGIEFIRPDSATKRVLRSFATAP
jgi:hypothetical protein